MSLFAYRNGEMHAEGVALATIASQVGTPFYCYSAGALRAAWREFADGIKGMKASVCYAMKANSNLAVIRLFGELGAGADIVSVGEMHRALAAGIPARRIIYSGVGKKASELMEALQAGVGQINVESSAELETLNAVAGQLGVSAKITIRVNPDVDAGTHAKITTGRKENKFGIDIDLAREAFALAGRLPNLKVAGVAMHIGSQLTSLEPYRIAIVRVATVGQARRRPQGHPSIWGGRGSFMPHQSRPHDCCIRQGPPARDRQPAGPPPGRGSGRAVSEVILVKPGVSERGRRCGMNDLSGDLVRAWHDVLPVATPRWADPL
jgi:diaminopimelate decarboxylase